MKKRRLESARSSTAKSVKKKGTEELTHLNMRAGTTGGAVASVQQGNITIAFSTPKLVRQNFLGDYFIEGPVTISAITPAPTGSSSSRRNGAMVNPSNYQKQCFDGRFSGGSFYDTTDEFEVGDTLSPGDSLTCSISRNPANTLAELGANPRGISEMQIFTCVATLPAYNTFRPQDCGTTKTLWTTDDVDPTIFLGLSGHHNPIGTGASKWDPVGAATAEPGQLNPEKWNIRTGGAGQNANLSGMKPNDQMYFYPSQFLKHYGRLALYTTTDLANVQTYAYRMLQFSIHMLGITQQTGWNFAFGAGYGGPYHLPLLFAARAFNSSVFSDIVDNNTLKGETTARFSEHYQYHYTTTPAAEYSAGLAAAGLSGPNYSIFGDNKDSPAFGGNSTDLDPHLKFNSSTGTGSNPAQPAFGTFGSRYVQVDGTCTHMYNTGAGYLEQNTGPGNAGARMWVEIMNFKSHSPGPWLDFFKWWMSDQTLGRGLGPSGTLNQEAYQFGGVAGDGGGDWMKEYYDAHIAGII